MRTLLLCFFHQRMYKYIKLTLELSDCPENVRYITANKYLLSNPARLAWVSPVVTKMRSCFLGSLDGGDGGRAGVSGMRSGTWGGTGGGVLAYGGGVQRVGVWGGVADFGPITTGTWNVNFTCKTLHCNSFDSLCITVLVSQVHVQQTHVKF